ncbi:MAG: hypothetical protein IJK97_08250 [Thermoguttaceae bacterium]|nr:hypothetical protein [Thermoguttaceae bacterium]
MGKQGKDQCNCKKQCQFSLVPDFSSLKNISLTPPARDDVDPLLAYLERPKMSISISTQLDVLFAKTPTTLFCVSKASGKGAN